MWQHLPWVSEAFLSLVLCVSAAQVCTPPATTGLSEHPGVDGGETSVCMFETFQPKVDLMLLQALKTFGFSGPNMVLCC